MASRARWWRSRAFRQAIIYFALLAVLVAALVGFIAWNTQQSLRDQTRQTLSAEIQGLSEQYARAGLTRLVEVIRARSSNPGNGVYLLTGFNGQIIAGNIRRLPLGTLDRAEQQTVRYEVLNDAGGRNQGNAIIQVFSLSGGFRLVVGRDISSLEDFLELVERSGRIAALVFLILGVGGGYLIARSNLRRIEQMRTTSQRIMAGNLDERIGLDGSGDEFDRLGTSLNEMLDRISLLMAGMRGVSDNIAHDLRSPLTRLRGRIESGLRAQDENVMRETLEETIEETNRIIATFNALLTIARTESGADDLTRERVDLAQLVEELAELYEPSAQEAGFTLILSADKPAPILANRPLLAQAVSNLIENALRHGKPTDLTTAGSIDICVSSEAHKCSVTIADNGPGIPAKDRKRVLERFIRLDESRSEEGSGLGLALVSAVATAHGAKLDLSDNNPGLRIELEFARDGSANTDQADRSD